MEFVEAKLAINQTDNLGLYDGLAVSEHFIERVIQRNGIKTGAEYVGMIQKIMTGIVRLDTKNLAEDFLRADQNDICLVLDIGVFYVSLVMRNNTGRMIVKTFIPFSEMTNTKKARFIAILDKSKLKKRKFTCSRFTVISSKSELGVHEVYEDFIKDYVISDTYVPPPITN